MYLPFNIKYYGFLILFFSNVLHAQQTPFKFRKLTIEDGLSQNTVYKIIQDSRGFIWMATEGGLDRYDGYKFKHFRHDPNDSTSISDNFVRDICEYPVGILWIATDGGGLNRFDVSTGKFKNYKHIPDSSNSISSDEIRSLYIDKNKDLWIGTDGGGLNKFDIANEQFTYFAEPAGKDNTISADRIWKIYEDTSSALPGFENILWIATNRKGFSLFDKKREEFTNLNHDPNNPKSISSNRVRDFFSHPDYPGIIWIGTQGGGLYKGIANAVIVNGETTYNIELTNNLIKSAELPPYISSSIRNINYFVDLQDGLDLMIGTIGDGLIFIDPENMSVKHNFKTGNSNDQLAYDSVVDIFRDASGSYWLGTDGGGVNIYTMNEKGFVHIKRDPGNRWGLNNDFIWSILENEKGEIWVGTDGGGINIIDKNTGRTSYITKDGSSNSLSDNRISYLYEDPAGNGNIYWIGTWNSGLTRFDRKKNTFRHYRNNKADDESLSHNFIKHIIKDNDNPDDYIYWISTGGGGLNKLDSRTGKFERYLHDENDFNSIGHNFIWKLYIDRKGDYWCATKGGLNYFDPVKKSFTSYQNEPGNISSLSHNYVFDIYEDTAGKFWVATFGGGLNIFDRQRKTFQNFREKDGLANDVVYAILEDSNGDIWVSTNKGLSKILLNSSSFHPDDNFWKLTSDQERKIRFINFDVSDGLQSNEFNSGAFFKNQNGEMYFGGINGISFFNPSRVKLRDFVPNIVVTDFRKFNEEVVLDSAVSYLSTLNLDYTDNLISFEFASLDYCAPENNVYAYRVIGLNDNWITLHKKREIDLTNLSHGTYILHVIGSNSDGIWNTEGVKLVLDINPPLWNTWWFRSLLVTAISLTVWGMFIWRTRLIRTRNRVLKEINLRMNEEIKRRRQVENALKVSEERFRSLYENSLVGLYRSTIDGRPVMVNPALMNMLGFNSLEELSKTNIERDLYLYPMMRERFFNKLRVQGEVNGYEAFWKSKNGEVIAVREYARIVKSEYGEFIEGTIENITEQKHAQKAIVDARDKAERSDKLKSEFLAQMSHEIRTPINTILSFSGLLREEIKDSVSEDLKDCFESIQYAGARIIRTIDMLLNMSEIQTGTYDLRKREIDLWESIIVPIHNEISILARDKNLKLKIKNDIPGGSVILNIDEYTTAQIFNNLLHNAIKYTEKGRVELTLYHDEGKNVLIDIKDTGIGISNEYLPIIFNPFTQEEQGYTRRFEGTGLGLALVKQYCRLNNADIKVKSEKGKGSTFTLIFKK